MDKEEAISPILAIVLMVAAVVAIAAIAVLWLTSLASNDASAPEPVTFSRTDDPSAPGGFVQVIQARTTLQWSDLSVVPSAAGMAPCTFPSSGTVTSGDRITCPTDGPYSLVVTAENRSIFSIEFHP